MASDSKIRFFLITVALVFAFSSCNKKNDVIPDTYVNFILRLNDAQFVDLNAMGGSVTVDSHTNNWGSGAAGYDGNGIIIYAGVEVFYAYDRTCPHDYAVNGLSVKVNIDLKNSTMAICPKCGTTYSLSNSGMPVSGIGRYYLKNYKTSFDGGNLITVWN